MADRLIFSLVFPALLLTASCEKASTDRSPTRAENRDAVITLPHRRTLKNREGKEIEVTVVSRGADSVTFIRMSDHREFTTPLDTFSLIDQEFLLTIPITTTPVERPEELSPKNRFSSFVKAREERIVEAQKEIALIDEKMKSSSFRTHRGRTLMKEKASLEKEIVELKEEIVQFREMGK